LYGLTRYTRSLAGGGSVFLDVEQLILPGQLNMAAGSYALSCDLVSSIRNTNSAAFGPNTGYLVRPVPDHGLDNTRGVPHSSTWVSVIPDGVATVRWTFGCYPAARVRCAAGIPHTYTVEVVQNVAARRVPDSGSCPGCAQPVQVEWLARDGSALAAFGPTEGNLPAPPFVAGGEERASSTCSPPTGSRRPGSERRRRTPSPRWTHCSAPAAQPDVAAGGCGIDHESVWTSPAVAEPLTSFQRAGHFAGYRYGAPVSEIGLEPGPGASLRTARGLSVGATIGAVRRLYGRRVSTRVSRSAGSWRARVSGGTIGGAVLPIRYPLRSIGDRNPIVTIEAGDTGCRVTGR
jgi:hypothetical protein